MTIDSTHGEFGSNSANFIRMLKSRPSLLSKARLAELALDMEASPDTLDPGPDTEENLFVPAGYTYFGQFIDHDLTLDTNSTFDGTVQPENGRTPRFDLDCVYKQGPLDNPQMYEVDGATLKLGLIVDSEAGRLDLLRGPDDRAIIGDLRNDENSLVSQIHASMIRYHNKQVATLSSQGLSGTALFNRARNFTRWAYQRIIVDDYLKRIVDGTVIQNFELERNPSTTGRSQNESAFRFYPHFNRAALPIEFAGAAYRFGHSMIRNGYILRGDAPAVPIFDGVMGPNSLIGFQKLPPKHVINDWTRFFPDASKEESTSGETLNPAPGVAAGVEGKNAGDDDEPGKPRLQFAYRIDTSIVNPLASLPVQVTGEREPIPSLLVRNLWRGASFQLASGQDFAKILLDAGVISENELVQHLVIKQQLAATTSEGDKQFRFVKVDADVAQQTPLWFYVLAEAQKNIVAKFGIGTVFNETQIKDAGTETASQLGAVGGRIILEVFNGLLDSDPESYRNHPEAAAWKPDMELFRLWNIVTTN